MQDELAQALLKAGKNINEYFSSSATDEERYETLVNAYKALTPEEKAKLDYAFERNALTVDSAPVSIEELAKQNGFGQAFVRGARETKDQNGNTVYIMDNGGAGSQIRRGDIVRLYGEHIYVYSKEGTFQVALNADGSTNSTLTKQNKNFNIPTNTGGDQLSGTNSLGKLENPVPDQSKGTSLVTPNPSDDKKITNTGNVDGKPNIGGTTTVTPIPDAPNKDDLVYLADGRDNRLPIPEPIVASNGLKVESNTKHTLGAPGYRPDVGIEPRNTLELFNNSVSVDGNKARYSIGSDGSIHRFFPDNSGSYHWSGSTGDAKNPMKLDNKTRAQLRKQEGWKIK